MSIVAEFVRTKAVDISDLTQSIAIINLNGKEIEHYFWYSCINQYGKEGTKDLLVARVLYENGFHKEAHAIMSVGATGSISRVNGEELDTRNWRKLWIDSNPMTQIINNPEIDPLL